MIVPEWVGETCFIVACGPSLRTMDVRQLHHYGRVITINDSFELTPYADVLYFCDLNWYLSRKTRIQDMFQGRHIITLENELDGIITMKATGVTGLETDPAGLRHGSNSGYQAIGLAYHFGVSRICLLGYDMKVEGDWLHWNQRPERQNAVCFQQTLNDVMLPNFESLKQPLVDVGIEVINCNPNSALRVWPFVSLNKILYEERSKIGYQ